MSQLPPPLTAYLRALSSAVSRATCEQQPMTIYRLGDTVFVQHSSLALPPDAQALDSVCAPGACLACDQLHHTH